MMLSPFKVFVALCWCLAYRLFASSVGYILVRRRVPPAVRAWDLCSWTLKPCTGVGFLFRVGLAIFTSCKQAIMTTNGRDAVFDILMHPPLTSLPDTPDLLIDLALSEKLKEGDLQKQRAKMEAQLKRSTQSTRGLLPQSGRVSVSTPAISLPKSWMDRTCLVFTSFRLSFASCPAMYRYALSIIWPFFFTTSLFILFCFFCFFLWYRQRPQIPFDPSLHVSSIFII